MQKLYKVAFQKIINKIGADKVETLNVESVRSLLKQKNIPLEQVDQTIFHKIPRQELKNLFRNPCPVSKSEQLSTEYVTSSKAVRAALNIEEKRTCFKCPFVATCDKAFLQPPKDYKISDPLPNLLVSMKNLSQLQNNETFKPRSWISAVKICDSMNSVLDDLMLGAQQFKTFRHERLLLKDQAEAQNEKKQKVDKKQLIKQAKKQKIPLKDVYAQIPLSQKQQANPQKQGQQAFEQLSKGPENIFKKKKSEQFIKIAQKYINEQHEQSNKKRKQEKKQNKQQKKSRKNNNNQQDEKDLQREPRREFKRQTRGQERQSRGYERQGRSYERQGRGQQRQRFSKGREDYKRDGNVRGQRNFRQQNNRKYDNNREKSKNFRDRESDFEGQYQPKRYDRNKQPARNQNQRSYQNNRQRDFSQQEESNPKIRRYSKERPAQNRNYQQSQQQVNPLKKSNKLDKFFTQMSEQKSDEEEILSSFNRRESQSKTTRLPRDARERNQDQGRGSSMQFSEKEMREFERLQKVPKILKTQFASKEDIQQRANQSSQSGESERKGRRVRR